MKTKLCLFLKCYFFKKKTQYFFLSFLFYSKDLQYYYELNFQRDLAKFNNKT